MRGKSEARARRRETLVGLLRSGGRVPLFGQPRAWGMALGMLTALSVFAFEAWLLLRSEHHWAESTVSLLISGTVFLELAYEWGKARHHGLRLGDRHLETWDWLGRLRLLAYDDIQAVRARRHFLTWILSVYRTTEDGSAAWHRIISYPPRGEWLVIAAAREIVRRCGLVERSADLWVRSPVDELPEPVSWE